MVHLVERHHHHNHHPPPGNYNRVSRAKTCCPRHHPNEKETKFPSIRTNPHPKTKGLQVINNEGKIKTNIEKQSRKSTKNRCKSWRSHHSGFGKVKGEIGQWRKDYERVFSNYKRSNSYTHTHTKTFQDNWHNTTQ